MLADYTELLRVVKQASRETEQAGRPVQVCFGRVTQAEPLKIMVEQKLVLGKAQLVLSGTVGSATLAAGEEVILLRMQGGQKFIVLDRMVKL